MEKDRKYFLTIVNLKNGLVDYLIANEENITDKVKKELGGWENLIGSSNSNRDLDDLNYQYCGTTRDNQFMFSILCLANKPYVQGYDI